MNSLIQLSKEKLFSSNQMGLDVTVDAAEEGKFGFDDIHHSNGGSKKLEEGKVLIPKPREDCHSS